MGVPERIRKLADEEETLWKPSGSRHDDTYDYHADNWYDVYVDTGGKFLGFVEPPKFLRKVESVEAEFYVGLD